MANDYFNHDVKLVPGTKARSNDVNTRFDRVVTGFDKLPAPHPSGGGFSDPVTVGTPTALGHAVSVETAIGGGLQYAEDTGVANAYVIALPIALTSYRNGLTISFKALNANTGASTINVNGLGLKQLCRRNGDPLGVGDIVEYQIVTFIFTANQFVSPSLLGGQLNDFSADVTEAVVAAQTAQGLAEDAQGLAEDARDTAIAQVALVEEEGITQIAAVQSASTVEQGNISTASTAAQLAVATAGSNAQTLVQGEGTGQIAAVASAGSTQVGLVNTAGSTQTGLVNSAGSTQVGLVEGEGDTQVARVIGEGDTQEARVIVAGTAAVTAQGLAEDARDAAITAQGLAVTAQGLAEDARDEAVTAANSVNARNLIGNSRGSINQRNVSGTVTLSAGDYGHDRWKAGAAGCAYTFASSGGITTWTIPAGDSLVQVVKGNKIRGGTYTLTWTGTAQASINGGAAGNSGMTATLTANTDVTVEFGEGTFSVPMLYYGTGNSDYDWHDDEVEEPACQRYLEGNFYGSGAPNAFHIANTGGGASTKAGIFVPFSQVKNAAPSMTLYTVGRVAGSITRCNIFGGTVDTVTPTIIATKTGYYIQANVDTTVSGFKWYWEASDEP